jgi:arsenite methyltransferase
MQMSGPVRDNVSFFNVLLIYGRSASYQIYAIKPILAQGDPTQSLPEPLLRWWDAYPKPRSEVAQISPEEVAALLRSPAADSCAVIDVRRDDFIGGHVRGCFQHPAQTFYDELPVFYAEFHNKGKLIFYCQSSEGRATRCAGWYQDFLEEKTLDVKTEKQEVLVMEGGIKAFKVAFASEKDLIEGDDN